jgi:hypothetical protein
MIRASFQQDWASRGCFRYTWTTRHPKPACTEQGLLISVRSGLKRQGRRRDTSVEPVGPQTRPDRGRANSPRSLQHSRHAQCYWSPTAWNGVSHRIRRAPPVRKFARSQHPPPVAARPAYERPLRPPDAPKAQTPEQGRQGRNHSRCAGITK